MVAGSAGHLRGVQRLRRLRDLAGLLGGVLLRLAVPLAVLLAVPRRLRRGCLRLRPAVRVVPVLGGADHPDLPARVPDDLLLLPQGLLPRVLAEPARLRRGRAARRLLRRDPAAADPQQRPPLVLVRRGAGRPGAELRRGAGLPRRRPRVGPHGPRHAADAGQRGLHLALHALLPLLPPHRGRPDAPLQQAPGPLPDVDVRVAAQRQPRPLRLGLAVLGGAGRPLHLPAGHRHDRGRDTTVPPRYPAHDAAGAPEGSESTHR